MQVRTHGDLAILIRDRRQELGLRQATLAARAGVSRQWIVEVEKGKPRGEVGLVLRTLRVLGIVLTATLAAPHRPVPSRPRQPSITDEPQL